ncbi:MAG TPA: zinc ribbon domain-containing protein, partial [Candidatus Limnocylindria bacterium]|nr:zinc ribbon domain-containing protein [Candidatus Limnocylindria bacterium]
RFCDSCGRPLSRTCASCGDVNDADARFCNGCGAPLPA